MLPDLRSLFGSANPCLLGSLRQFRQYTALVRMVQDLADGHAPVATITAGGCVLVGRAAVLDLPALARLAHGSSEARRDVHG